DRRKCPSGPADPPNRQDSWIGYAPSATKSVSTMVRRPDLTRIVLSVLLMGILISGSFWILRPFLLSTIWATMIVVATWPMMLKLQARLGRRVLAVAIMSSAMVLVFVAPLLLAIQTLVENTDTL